MVAMNVEIETHYKKTWGTTKSTGQMEESAVVVVVAVD